MKKSLILGAAAMMAVVAAAPQAEAAEVKLGGYYIFRVIDEDATLADTAGSDELSGWRQRLQLNLSAKISDKTSAHFQWRPTGSTSTVQGASADVSGTSWDVKRLWAETEMYGLGLKVGNLPLSINDGLLFKDAGGSFGSIVVSKSFGDVTLVGLNVRVTEGAVSGANADSDNVDVYGLSLLGKAGKLNYQLTWAHMDGDANNAVTAVDMDNDWIALTAGGKMGSVKLTGTVIWENGLDFSNAASAQTTDSGVMAALKLDGKTGFGGWKGYAFYSSEDFSHPQASTLGGASNSATNRSSWSTAWDGGVGSRGPGLFEAWALDSAASKTVVASKDQNMWGLGATLSIKAGAWTIAPALDYASFVEDNVAGAGKVNSDSAWGGSITASTKLDEGTTFSMFAIGLNPSDDVSGTTNEMHTVGAQLKVKF